MCSSISEDKQAIFFKLHPSLIPVERETEVVLQLAEVKDYILSVQPVIGIAHVLGGWRQRPLGPSNLS